MAKPDHPHGKDNHKSSKHEDKRKHGDKHDSDDIRISIGEDRLVVIREKLSPYYTNHCPPGLAKKRNGCLPPGQAKKYRVGDTFPSHMQYWDVPRDVLVLLPAAPAGAHYIWVDRDILLISEASKKIIDAMVILSAL